MKSEKEPLGPFTIKQIAVALRLTVPQIQQWIGRGYLRPTGEEGRGRRARQWTVEDATRARICHQVVGTWIPQAEYADAIEAACNAPSDYILVIVRPGDVETGSTLGGFNTETFNFRRRGEASWQVISAKEAAKIVLQKALGARQITLIDIAALIEETRTALEFFVRAGGKPALHQWPDGTPVNFPLHRE